MNEMRYQLNLLKAMNQKLAAKERMYHMVCDASAEAFLYYSFEKNEVVTLGKWHDFFDFEVHDMKEAAKLFDAVDESCLLKLRDVLFLEKSGEASLTAECLMKDKKRWFRFCANVTYDALGHPEEKVICASDITKFKNQNEELTYMAYYDGLTGLYNRNYFVRQLGEFVRTAKERNSVVSVLVIDIDDFRKINDGMGLVVGDELVQQFGSFLKELCSREVIVCHLSSDVYCMAIYEPMGDHSVEHIHKTIQKRTREPFCLSSGQELQITVSIGVAEFPEAASSALELMKCAEIVMFKGKSTGKNTIRYFNASILNEFLETVELENKLKEAVFKKNFVLYFQPQFYAGNQKLRGVEALVRWREEDGKMISPSVFIPIAEKNGAIIPIGNWVVEQSIRQYSAWRKQYGVSFIMSINISALQCARDDFVDSLLKTIRKYQVDPSDVELEITESILINDFDMVSDKLKQLHACGIKISLDDFGTGFSSLSYLKQLPIDTLKLDKSFTDTVLTDSATRVITESIINMVECLGFESIAEGVEDEQQYKYLHAIGCDVIQGYLCGKPQPPEELEKLFQKAFTA